jgi:hypothetical protein
MVGLTFSYVVVNILILRKIRKQAEIAANSLTEFQTQVAGNKTQFAEQLEVLKEQSKSTLTSAQAAKNTSAALIAIERAYIDVQIRGMGASYDFVATNHGRTPAKLTHYISKAEYLLQGPNINPEERFLPSTDRTITLTRLLGQNEHWEFLHLNIALQSGQDLWSKIQTNQVGFAFSITLYYEDFLGEPHQSELHYFYDIAQHYLMPIRDPNVRRYT